MMMALHKDAGTTLVRTKIAAKSYPDATVARRYGMTEQSSYKWKKHQAFTCPWHMAHRPRTHLNPSQQIVTVHMRRTQLLLLDDLLAVTREFLCPEVLRSGLGWCPRHHGLGNLNAINPARPQDPQKAFDSA